MPPCSSSDLTRDGHGQRDRPIYAGGACGRHATSESVSLVADHGFSRDIILLAVRYYLQLGVVAEPIAGVLADRGIDVSGRTILRWVHKFGPVWPKKFGVIGSCRHDLAGGQNLLDGQGKRSAEADRAHHEQFGSIL